MDEGSISPRGADRAHIQRARALARRCGEISIALGIVVLAGWVLDIGTLKSISPSLNSMKANTAIMLVLSGLAVRLTASGGTAECSRAAFWLAAAAVAIALATLSQYAFGIDLGIDQLLFSDDSGIPGRPSPHTAIAFAAIAGTLMALNASRPWAPAAAQAGAVLASVVTATAVIGYAYDVDYLRGLSGETGVALHTMVAFVLLTVGTLCARPERTWAAIFVSDSPGGGLARRLTPAVLAIPIVLGAELLLGSGAMVASLTALVLVFLVVGFVLYLAGSIDAVDRERVALAEQLKSQAQHDPLTGLFNRRRLDEELRLLRSVADRYKLKTALMAIDVDSFKRINDTYGHPAGDQVLVAVADAMRAGLRESDVIGRPGGDEFVALMPEVDDHRASQAARRVLAELRRASAASEGPEFTVSIGLAIQNGGVSDAELLATADRALYEAKANGGDAYSVAQSEAESLTK